MLGLLEGNNAGVPEAPSQFWRGLAIQTSATSPDVGAEMVDDFHSAGWAIGLLPYFGEAHGEEPAAKERQARVGSTGGSHEFGANPDRLGRERDARPSHPRGSGRADCVG